MSKELVSQLSDAMLDGRNDDIMRLAGDLYDWMEAHAKEEEAVNLAGFLTVTRLPYKETEILTVCTEGSPAHGVIESKREFASFMREMTVIARSL